MEIRTEVEIAAPIDRVWDVLTDFSRYGDWNPFMNSVEGALEEGERLRVVLTTADGSEWTVRPRLLRVVQNAELRWQTRMFFRGLFDGEHYFTLAEKNGGTLLVQAETFTGLLLGAMSRTVTERARGFVGMNQALKKRVEG
ncbi:MAG: SRPBCC domain-containing protein [Myxococcales bacterium]|nr:SRPBCC domain-containing protein [Myxococcales bacterium]